MALRAIQVTLPAVGSQPTQLTTAANRRSIRHLIAEADDGNSAPAFMGVSGMATDGSEGILLIFSATVPGRVELGPFSGDGPVNTDEVFFVGTEAEIINVLVVTQ